MTDGEVMPRLTSSATSSSSGDSHGARECDNNISTYRALLTKIEETRVMANPMVRLPVGLRYCANQCATRQTPHRSTRMIRPQFCSSAKQAIRTAPTRCRNFHSTTMTALASKAPKSRDRGPPSKEDTQTDFAAMDVLNNSPAPTTGIDACQSDGFALNSGNKVVGSGVLLVAGEAFRWKPWVRKAHEESEGIAGHGDVKGMFNESGKLVNTRGQWDVDEDSWGVLKLVWPKPGTFSQNPLLPAELS